MPVPTHVFDPPFNIIRCSHAVLEVVDLGKSRAFYENTVGLHVEDADDKAVYLRGSEEHQHHSLVLRKAATAACNRLGFKVGNDGDLDKAASFFSENGITYAFVDQPFQGRTLQFTDPAGFQLELYATMEKRPHLLRRYDLYKGCHPQRLDHFNVFAPEVQNTIDFYARLGFRLTEYMAKRTDRTDASPPSVCTARATSMTSPSPTAAGRACTTSLTGRRPR
jgi:catechol 2,3-dioxygenase